MENLRRRQFHIPNDLFFSVLSKLPIKSLKRFECVCKSWSLLFDNPNFITIYRNCFLTKDHSYYNDKSLLLHNTISAFDSYYFEATHELYSVSGERFENKIKLDWPDIKLDSAIDPSYSGFNILGCGSINGILCLICVENIYVILWNPTTKEFKNVPRGTLDSIYWIDHRGFGYDHIKNDYKVIRHGVNIPETNSDLDEHICLSIWEIYSLRSNSWKVLEVDMKYKSYRWNNQDHVYMDGLTHGLGIDERDNESCLISFDWSNEVFVKTPLSLDIDNNNDVWIWTNIVLLNGSIASISNFEDTFHISILGELGIKESWIKILVIGSFPCLEYPIGAGKKGDMLFRKKDGGLVWFDLYTQMIEDLGITVNRFNCRFVIHGENLTPLEGNNI